MKTIDLVVPCYNEEAIFGKLIFSPPLFIFSIIISQFKKTTNAYIIYIIIPFLYGIIF